MVDFEYIYPLGKETYMCCLRFTSRAVLGKEIVFKTLA